MSRNKNPVLIILITGALIVGSYVMFSHHRSSQIEKTTSEAQVPPTPAELQPAPEPALATPPSPRPIEKVQVAPPPSSPAPKPRTLVVKGVYNPPPLEGPHAAELTRIQDLSVTYDAREVPALAAFLTHDSAEVRAAALDGLIRLGSKEAAEPLRAASAKVKDPREAIAMLDAADYLELPPMPASMLRKRKEPKASATPGPATSEPKKTTAVGGG
jgi:hypothetical protein